MRAARRRPFRPNAATGKRQGTAGVHHPLGSPCFWFTSESCRKQDAAERREQHERSASLNAHFSFFARSLMAMSWNLLLLWICTPKRFT